MTRMKSIISQFCVRYFSSSMGHIRGLHSLKMLEKKECKFLLCFFLSPYSDIIVDKKEFKFLLCFSSHHIHTVIISLFPHSWVAPPHTAVLAPEVNIFESSNNI